MNKQHEDLEKKGVKTYISKTMFGRKAKKAMSKWSKEEAKEQEMERKMK